MKKIILLVAVLLSACLASGLGELAGLYVFNVPVGQTVTGCLNGQSGCMQWGLLSDMNESVTVNISAAGEGAPYLKYPNQLMLKPNVINYVNVTASIPANYSGNMTMNATLTALQGCTIPASGGFSVCFQLAVLKSVVINVLNYAKPVADLIPTVYNVMVTQPLSVNASDAVTSSTVKLATKAPVKKLRCFTIFRHTYCW